MNRSLIVGFGSLLVLALAIPIYGLLEPWRMAQAQEELRQQYVSDAAVFYVENCAICHGARGEGIGANVSLDNTGLREADYDVVYKTIARGRYDTAMAGWHEDEGGIFNDYQIEELVALIRYVDWPQVGELSAQRGLIPPTLPIPTVDDEFLAQVAVLDPEGATWAQGIQYYAEQCTICHGVSGEGTILAPALNTAEIRATDDTELARIIREGVPGTLMTAWGQTFAETDIDALVTYLQNWDRVEEAGLALTPPMPIQIDVNSPEEMLALGERIFNSACVACHGENGSGGIGPAINSQQFFSRQNEEQIRNAVVYGGNRSGSSMPAFGDRLTSVEIDALVQFVRDWEPTAPWVANPRGTEQGGGGPPWLRATPDPSNPVQPRGGPPRLREAPDGNGPASSGQEIGAGQAEQMGPALFFRGEVIAVAENMLTFRAEDGAVVEAMLGPPWYWSENGIALVPGDSIELEGFESPDHMELNWIRNLTSSQDHRLRTPEGVPVWSQ